MNKITPFLWFDTQAEEAMNLYVSIFKNSKVLFVAPGPNGIASSVSFELEGQVFMAFNAGPEFKFTEAISFYVDCKTQEEVDYFWDRLSEGGEKSQCGWLKDKFGLSWQIVPSVLGELLGGPEPENAKRAMDAMLTMSKLDIAALRRAYDGQ
jgi:predicted 3-demethylubiquinone-9 3-methyltransferase (glyoxalase superfamily)